MPLKPFTLVAPSTRDPSVAMTGRLPVKTESPVYATYHQGNPEKIKTELLHPLDGVDLG